MGTDLHLGIELYLTDIGAFQTWCEGSPAREKLIKPAISTLPLPGPDLAVEQAFELITYPGGPLLKGVVDLAHARDLAQRDVIVVWDHKTSANPKYRKTSEELQENLQANVYAVWAYGLKEPLRPGWDGVQDGVGEVEFSHHYVGTRSPSSALVTASMPWNIVAREWVKVQDDVRAMVELAGRCPDDPLKVPGEPSACDAFGGCYFKREGFCRDMIPAGRLLRTQGESDMDKVSALREKMAARRAALSPTAETTEEAQGILPPDAPPREMNAEEIVSAKVEAETKKRRGRPKKATPSEIPALPEIALSEIPAPAPIPAPASAAAVAAPKGLALVDSISTTPAAFEACFGRPEPIDPWISKVAAEVSSAWGVADPGLIDYGKGKGAMKVGLTEAFATTPPPTPCLVSAYGRWSDAFLEVAQENNWVILRGVR
jgi:hypothetical protein